MTSCLPKERTNAPRQSSGKMTSCLPKERTNAPEGQSASRRSSVDLSLPDSPAVTDTPSHCSQLIPVIVLRITGPLILIESTSK